MLIDSGDDTKLHLLRLYLVLFALMGGSKKLEIITPQFISYSTEQIETVILKCHEKFKDCWAIETIHNIYIKAHSLRIDAQLSTVTRMFIKFFCGSLLFGNKPCLLHPWILSTIVAPNWLDDRISSKLSENTIVLCTNATVYNKWRCVYDSIHVYTGSNAGQSMDGLRPK